MENLMYNKKHNAGTVGYVYVIELEGHYKIGKTLTYVDRFYEYTKFYAEPNVIFCEFVEDYGKVEFELHNIFLDKNIRGEWFDLDEKDLKIIERYLTINKATFVEKQKPESKKEEKPATITEFRNKKMKMTHIKDRYVKVMPMEQRLLAEFKRTPASLVVLNYMKMYLVPNFNILVKDNKKYSMSKLARDMGMTRQSASFHIKRLKELNVVADYEYGRKGKYLAINPRIYLAGDYVPEEILQLFDKH